MIKRLEIREDFTVLEVEPGPEFDSVSLAKKLSRGKLMPADIQPQMLEYAGKRLKKRGLTNVD